MSSETPVYEEIDLRPYIQAVLQKWWLILLAGLVAGVVAFVAMLFVPATYESSALVLVTKPRFNLQFDPRIQTPDTAFAYLAYPTLALSDVVVDELVAAMDPSSVEVFRKRLSAQNGADPSLIVLTVTHDDPLRAAEVANAWAELFVGRANQVFGQQGDEPVQFLRAQLVRTQAELDRLDEALVALQAQNPQQLLMTELNSSIQAQASYLGQVRSTADVRRDVEAYAAQLAMRPATGSLSTADSTAVLLLQAQAFRSGSSLMVEVAPSADSEGLQVSDGVEILTDLVQVLALREASLAAELAMLEPQILEMQELLQVATGEYERLQSEQELAFATYTTLGRALDEVLITNEDTAGQVRLASYAGVAEEPVGPRKGLNSAVAALLGLFIGFAWVLGRVWWTQGLIRPNSMIN